MPHTNAGLIKKRYPKVDAKTFIALLKDYDAKPDVKPEAQSKAKPKTETRVQPKAESETENLDQDEPLP